jgi:hypothetical protein
MSKTKLFVIAVMMAVIMCGGSVAAETIQVAQRLTWWDVVKQDLRGWPSVQPAAVSVTSSIRPSTTNTTKATNTTQTANNRTGPAALGAGCNSVPLPSGADAQTVRCANGQWVSDYNLFNSGQAIGIGTSNITPGFKVEIQGHEKLNGNLEAAGAVKGTQLCIGNDCRGSWPGGSGGTADNLGNHTATQNLNLNLNELTNATKVYGREIEAANGPSSPYHTYLNYQNSGKNYIRGNTIFADIGGGNVGIGVDNPTAKLEVAGGIKLVPATGQPTCTASTRGTMWYVPDTGDGNDHLYFCMKRSGTFQWLGN